MIERCVISWSAALVALSQCNMGSEVDYDLADPKKIKLPIGVNSMGSRHVVRRHGGPPPTYLRDPDGFGGWELYDEEDLVVVVIGSASSDAILSALRVSPSVWELSYSSQTDYRGNYYAAFCAARDAPPPIDRAASAPS
jgi:hypothetical protein